MITTRYRNVDVDCSRLMGLFDGLGTVEGGYRLIAEYPKEIAAVRRRARLVPVAVDGNRAVGRKMGYFETRLRDGTRGYFQRRVDDCLQASIATLAQVPIYEVPDPEIDKQLAAGRDREELGRAITRQFAEWADERGLTILRYAEPPIRSERWMGVASSGDGNPFHDHCVVMTGSECLWDTTRWLPPTKHEPIASSPDAVGKIYYGITIERKLG